MDLAEQARGLIRKLREGRRRRWVGGTRAHLELRGRAQAGRLRGLLERLEGQPGVLWARYNAHLERVVVAFDEGRRQPEDVRDLLMAAEQDGGLAREAFSAHPADHPGDDEPIIRAAVGLCADAAAFGAGAILRALHRRTRAREFDLAALVSTLEGIPEARRTLRRLIGPEATDLVLGVTSAFSSALLKGSTGPIVGILRRGLRLRSLLARRRAWRAVEPLLCGDPDCHPATRPRARPRPCPRPPGEVDDYSDKAVLASLGGFGFGVASTGRIEQATASLFTGMPKPARLGRHAFGSVFGAVLGRNDLVVMDFGVERRLDRVDTLVVDASLLAPGREGSDAAIEPGAEAFVATVRRAGLRLVLADDGCRPGWAEADAMVPGGRRVAASIRKEQRRHRFVCYVGRGASAGYAAADISLGLVSGDRPPPWGAKIIGRCDLAKASLLVEGIAAARAVARQSVALAQLEGAAGLLLSLGKLDERGLGRVITASNLGAFAAMVNATLAAHRVRVTEAPAVWEHAPWHALPAEQVLARLQSSERGLGEQAARDRRRPPRPVPSPLAQLERMVAQELATPLTPILATGAILSAFTGAMIDAVMIGSVIGVNALVGGTQRYHTERALRALDVRERHPVRVRRGDAVVEVPADEVVEGDVVELAAGDVVPADCRLLATQRLEVDESRLTGESAPVAKDERPTQAHAIADRTSMLYDGTTVAAGTATAVVVATGAATEARRAASLAAQGPPATGVEARLDALTALTVPVAAASGLGLVVSGLSKGRPHAEVVGAGVSLAVAAAPEGLPLLATVAQLAAARRLSEHGVLARNPRAIEALGRVDILCADKTGTLTEGRIQLRLVSVGGRDVALDELDAVARRVVVAGLRASPDTDAGRAAHNTDAALIAGAADAGISQGARFRRVAELPFEPARSYHATLGADGHGRLLCVKGAPEAILPRCTHVRRGRVGALKKKDRDATLAEAIRLARRGLRVLAVATRRTDAQQLEEEDVGGLTFEGFLALADPIRATAKAAVSDLRRAGVEVMMLTGDHPSTAETIAGELEVPNGHVVTGPELDALDDHALADVVGRVRVFARVTPSHKVRIVGALQRAGRVVAMTGDGANDASAIRLADVGIAVGEGATSAARDASDLVVTTDRIEDIVHAVLEGRALWASVREAVSMLVGGNLGEIGFTLLGGLASGRTPLNARQLLLVNLLTDALPAMAIAVRPPPDTTPEHLLAEGPEASLGAALQRDLAWRALVTTAATGAGWLAARMTGSRRRAGTVALLSLVGTQLGQTLATGGRSPLVLWSALGSLAALVTTVEVPGVSQLFGSRPVGPVGLAIAAGAATAGTLVGVGAPPVARALAARLDGGGLLQRLGESDLGRLVVEARTIQHILTSLREEAAGEAA